MEITIGSEHSLTSAERRISTTSSWNRRFSRLFPLCSVLITALLLYSCGSTKYLYTPFTLPAGTIEVTFSVTADMRHYTGENINYFRNACEQIVFGGAGDFMVSPGDIDPPGNTYATIQKYIDPTYLWYPVAGNHETETASDMVWLRIFNRDGNTLPNIVNVGPAGCAETTYSFDYGNAHFSIIDSNKDFSPGSKQYQWLEQDLAKSKAVWKFVFHHHPLYSTYDRWLTKHAFHKNTVTSPRGDVKTRILAPLYEKFGVDVVWYGHVHSYERTWPIKEGKVNQSEGIIYIQTGGAGGQQYLSELLFTRSWFTTKVKRVLHYCLITIIDKNLRMMVYDIEGSMIDFLEVEK